MSYLSIQESLHNPNRSVAKAALLVNSSSTMSRSSSSSSRGKPAVGNGNGDAGSSYTPAKTAYPPTETHKRRGEESGFPCTDSFFICCCCFFCCCLLLVSMQNDLRDLYDRMTGAGLHQQTRICWDEACRRVDFFLILPFPVSPSHSVKAQERKRECVCV